MVVEYGLSVGNGEERERLWEDLDRIVDSVRNECRLCVLGYLNRWIRDKVRAGITCALEFQERMIMEEEV